MKCAVCSQKAKGLGYFNPRLPRSDPRRYSDRWVFCSMRCQNAFCKLMTKTEGQMIDPSERMREAPADASGRRAVAGMGVRERGEEGECESESVFHAATLERIGAQM